MLVTLPPGPARLVTRPLRAPRVVGEVPRGETAARAGRHRDPQGRGVQPSCLRRNRTRSSSYRTLRQRSEGLIVALTLPRPADGVTGDVANSWAAHVIGCAAHVIGRRHGDAPYAGVASKAAPLTGRRLQNASAGPALTIATQNVFTADRAARAAVAVTAPDADIDVGSPGAAVPAIDINVDPRAPIGSEAVATMVDVDIDIAAAVLSTTRS